MGIDIPVIWFVIIVFATLMYIVMDGFDLGIGILFGFVPNAQERDVMINSVAPVWDGNETWLVLGGAGLFGAFPGLRRYHRCAGYPAHRHAHWPDLPRRRL